MRVAVYCRVSTDKEDQANSFEGQKRYFSEVIGRREDMELYEIYADEGVSGTTTAKRREFNRMIADAKAGRFDRIITKEVSRFARNTVDTLGYTRELKGLGIGVEFVNDGINTLEPDAELRLSIMSSIAQEESRKTSSRVKWGQARRMEQGVVFGRSLLGYDVKNGQMTVNEEGAKIVRQIFLWYVRERLGAGEIADRLTVEGILTARGNREWSSSVIVKILKNEKYCGDLLQKKTVTPDYLTHRKVYNRGQEEMIYLRDHHEPIIDRELWQTAQEELGRRCRRKPKAEASVVMMDGAENISGGRSTYAGRNAAGAGNRYQLSGKIRCGCCGNCFVARWRISRNGKKYLVWRCAKAVKEGRDIGGRRGCAIGYQLRNEVIMELVRETADSGETTMEKTYREAIGQESNRTDITGAEELSRWERRKKKLEQRQVRMLDSYFAGEITTAEMEKMKAEYARQESELDRRMKQEWQRETADSEQVMGSLVEQILACPGKRVEIKLHWQPVRSVPLPDYREYTAKQCKGRGIAHENTVIGAIQGR